MPLKIILLFILVTSQSFGQGKTCDSVLIELGLLVNSFPFASVPTAINVKSLVVALFVNLPKYNLNLAKEVYPPFKLV